uniref:Uncharacterized protein n=1 Tax=Arundo donax TaxID=35708 RepID=A0A0A9C7G9_ARUDO
MRLEIWCQRFFASKSSILRHFSSFLNLLPLLARCYMNKKNFCSLQW